MSAAQKEQGNIALIVVIVVVVLALLGGGYYLYQRQNAANKQTPPPVAQPLPNSNLPVSTPSVVSQNPTESTADPNYQNPFDVSPNPFDNLQ